jgi:polysaccharide export outer membrane protein
MIPGLNVTDLSGGADESVTKVSENEEIHYLRDRYGIFEALRIITLTPQTLLKQVQAESQQAHTDDVLPQEALAAKVGEYRIGPGDILNVTVWEHPELTNPNGEFRDAASSGRLVGIDGTIFYPYVGSFNVAGLSPEEVRLFIGDKLSHVIPKPQVDVRVVSFRSQRVQISGEVKQPGLVTLDDTPKGILDALGERGGVTDNASRRTVVLSRDGAQYQINLQSLLTGTTTLNNPILKPGDVVHVPDRSSDEIFVLGEVNKEGPVYLQRRTTLTEALASATGLDKTGANGTGILVFRRPAKGDRVATVFRIDLSSAVGLLTAGEFELQPRDVVYVSPTAFAKYNSIINQLLPTITSIFQLDLIRANSR